MTEARRPGRGRLRPAPWAGLLLFWLAGPAKAVAAPDPEVPRLTAMSDSLWRAGQRDSAMVVLGHGIERARNAADTPALIDLLTRAGQQARFFGRVAEAETSLREAIGLATDRGDTLRVIAATRWLSVVAGLQGRPEEARDLARKLLALADARGDRRHQGWARVGLAWHAQREGHTDEAIRLYREAAPLFDEVRETEGTLWALLGLGFTSTSNGDYATAADAYRRTIALARERGEPVSEGIALNDLGKLEFYLGDPGAARELFRRAAEIHRRLGSWHEVVLPLVNLALCESTLGREAAAEETLQAGLNLCRAKGYGEHAITVRTHLAKLSERRGRKHEAARRYRELLEEDGLTLRSRVQALHGLAEALAAADSHAVALHHLSQACELLREHPDSELLPLVLLAQGTSLRAAGRTTEATATFLHAARSAEHAGQQQTHIQALIETASLWGAQGEPQRARSALRLAADLWERDRGRALDPTWREQRREIGPSLYAALLDDLLGDPETAPVTAVAAAFDRVQAFKSRTLLERMLGPGETLQALLDAEADTRITLARLQAEVLGPGELFLDLYASPGATTLFAVARDTVAAVRLPGERELGDAIRFHHQLCAAPPSRQPSPAALASLQAESRALRQRTFGAIEPLLAHARAVYVAPDGVFHLLPLAALGIRAAEPEERAAVEDLAAAQWIRVPSASVLAEQRRRARAQAPAPPRILAAAGTSSDAGSRLRGTEWEVGELSRRYRDVQVWNHPASAGGLPEEMGRSDLLHLACHLRLDSQNPWQSELQLQPAGSPANLRAAQIASMRLSARLAILSSCASADGRILSGEGVLGVTSAFLASGVPVVVATLWPVDDHATARFMTHLYDELARGAPVSEAVAGAQATTRRTPATAHPFYWAGFVVVGDGSVTIRPERRGPLGRYLPLAAAAGLLAALLVGAARAPRDRARRP